MPTVYRQARVFFYANSIWDICDNSLLLASYSSMTKDISQRFIFEQTDIRGELVSLDKSYQEILQQHYYPDTVAVLMGEFLAASVLLASTIKFEGRLVLQVRSKGDIPLLMVECSHDQVVRGLARFAKDVVSDDFHQQFDQGALVITVEPTKGEKYQGIVGLDGNTLASCIEGYFMQSEQLATRIILQANGKLASGLLLQQLPVSLVDDADEREAQWQHVLQLAQTITPEEQLSLNHNDLLFRLYHQDKVRLFEQHAVKYQCTCSRERTQQALLSVAKKELEQILAEDNEITMNCEFCNHTYRFSQADIEALFSQQA